MEDKLSSAAELPYFEGDFWPNVLEESIKELDQEEEEKRKQAEAAEAAANVSISLVMLVHFKRSLSDISSIMVCNLNYKIN